VPPFLADWSDAGAFAGVGDTAWAAIRRPPDWEHLQLPYLASVAYDLQVLGEFLATRVSPGALVIILGDHQPPAIISGEGQPWTVPIHVLSQDPDLLRPFAAEGYTPGAFPEQKAPWPGMESFMPQFLDAFSTPAAASE
jgi:hypothetical protein